MSSPKPPIVDISIKDGAVVCDPPRCRARRNDVIVWRCEAGHFAIEFFDGTPLDTVDAHSDARHQAHRTVRADAAPDIYRYACAVCVDGRVYLDACCPSIIIDHP